MEKSPEELELEARKIINHFKQRTDTPEHKHKIFLKCLEAGICPKCGKPLQLSEVSIDLVICPNKCLISSPLNPYQNRGFVSAYEFKNCANDEIRLAHRESNKEL